MERESKERVEGGCEGGGGGVNRLDLPSLAGESLSVDI